MSLFTFRKAVRRERRRLVRGQRCVGCTKNHDDGSADTIECTRAGCKHYHYDPARIVPTGGRVTVLRPIDAIAMR